jgi:hypothetical protein
VRLVVAAHRIANMPPSMIFDPHWIIDTGQIVNQGRAASEFRLLTTEGGLPHTPHEERGYGEVSFNAQRRKVWRLAPAPNAPPQGGPLRRAQVGIRNSTTEIPSMVLTELDGWLKPTDRAPIYINGVELEHIIVQSATAQYLMPGQRRP